ncbi:hypothetical protein ACVWZK_003658 [Bradyrhizobium sp. GM0.4]
MPDTGRIVLQRVRSSFNTSKQVSVTTQPHLVPSRGIGRTTALTRYSNSGDASDRLANATVGPADRDISLHQCKRCDRCATSA